MLSRRRSSQNNGLPMAHGGGGGTNDGGYYSSYSNSGSTSRGYGGYYSSGSSSHHQNLYSTSSSRSSSNIKMISILRVGIGITVLWSLIVGVWYWNLRSSLQEILLHIPEANPIHGNIWKNIPQTIDNYMRDLQQQATSATNQQKQKQREQQRKYQQELNQLERDNRFLQKERDELRVKYEGPDKVEEMARMQLRESAFQEQVELLQAATRRESKRTVLERFGEGPHFVKMFFEISEKSASTNYQGEFLIEMAPLDTVPHAVHLFMEQVAHGLWNQSAYFYLNGPHVAQAGPSLEDEFEEENDNKGDAKVEPADSRKAFEQMGLDELAFPDYSDKYPHTTWTLGYTGRPGGPDFYINKVDNTHSHGPGGQYQHALEEQGDACFGKIVQGQDSIKRIFTQPIYKDDSDWHYFLLNPVKITGAIIWKPDVLEEELQDATTTSAAPSKDNNNHDDDKVNQINEKLKRRPRLPKIDHAVEP